MAFAAEGEASRWRMASAIDSRPAVQEVTVPGADARPARP
jgi:hypothetical protein